ncbi:MAG TPA: CBS domain-containing protein [Motiliproteus sp.]
MYQPEGLVFSGPLEKLLERRPGNRRLSLQPHQPRSGIKGIGSNHRSLHAYQQVLEQANHGTFLPASELMQSPVATISYNASIREAWQNMATRNVAQMPVLSENQHPIGMLTWASLLKFVVFNGDQIRFVKGVLVRDIMWPELIAAEETTDVRRIVSMMVAVNINAVTVANQKDRLIGIISRSDILNLLAETPTFDLRV